MEANDRLLPQAKSGQNKTEQNNNNNNNKKPVVNKVDYIIVPVATSTLKAPGLQEVRRYAC